METTAGSNGRLVIQIDNAEPYAVVLFGFSAIILLSVQISQAFSEEKFPSFGRGTSSRHSSN
jgi:hypothetical protein